MLTFANLRLTFVSSSSDHVTLERARLPWHRKGLLLDTGDLAASTGRNNTHHSLILDRATSRWDGLGTV